MVVFPLLPLGFGALSVRALAAPAFAGLLGNKSRNNSVSSSSNSSSTSCIGGRNCSGTARTRRGSREFPGRPASPILYSRQSVFLHPGGPSSMLPTRPGRCRDIFHFPGDPRIIADFADSRSFYRTARLPASVAVSLAYCVAFAIKSLLQLLQVSATLPAPTESNAAASTQPRIGCGYRRQCNYSFFSSVFFQDADSLPEPAMPVRVPF